MRIDYINLLIATLGFIFLRSIEGQSLHIWTLYFFYGVVVQLLIPVIKIKESKNAED